MSDNLELWNSVEMTEDKFAKPFDNGSFKGVSANPMYLVREATNLWGPCGFEWGYKYRLEFLDTLVREDGTEKICIAHITIFYPAGDQTAEVSHCGTSKYIYKTSKGYWKADDEAPKKAITNGISKTLSMLGFSADLWLTYYDSPEYRQTVKETFEAEREAQKEENIRKRFAKILEQTGGDTEEDQDLLCRFWSENKYDLESAESDIDVVRSIVQAQSDMCSDKSPRYCPVAKQLDKAREFSKGGV